MSLFPSLALSILHGWAALDPHTLPQQIVNGLLIGSIYALIALGYTMVYGVLRLINFAHGEVFMLGAYTALFVSWGLGYTPNAPDHGSSIWNLIIMLLASMTVCAFVGVIIERFAYRPMRNQARIASLITAIGISLLLQYGGQIVLPTSPAPNINATVNPFPGVVKVPLTGKDGSLVALAGKLKPAADAAEAAYQEQLKHETDAYNLTPKGTELRNAEQDARNKYDDAVSKADNSAVLVEIPKGQLIMVGVTIVLMIVLTYLVMFTKQGRAMRAVSHDFDSASLMGVNVNSIVTFTFVLGSALAGAAAMMNATFLSGIKIDTFFGALPGVKAFVAAVLGGIGNIPGAVLGGLLMGVAENLVVWLGFPEWRDAVAFVILILILLVRPGGLLGSSKVEKV
jgi:branched-chain amino acid transport system permease protein